LPVADFPAFGSSSVLLRIREAVYHEAESDRQDRWLEAVSDLRHESFAPLPHAVGKFERSFVFARKPHQEQRSSAVERRRVGETASAYLQKIPKVEELLLPDSLETSRSGVGRRR